MAAFTALFQTICAAAFCASFTPSDAGSFAVQMVALLDVGVVAVIDAAGLAPTASCRAPPRHRRP
ncbi:hypothetical protein ACP4OV_031048 [Aristida adscensionis]